MIVIRTNHDIQTSYLYNWTKELISEAEKKGLKVIKIEGKDINERVIRSRVKKNQPRFIFFNGHGSAESLYDNNKKPCINLKSADIFKDTIAFTRACSCLRKLGASAVKKGCNAFIGYKKEFWIARNHKRECQPLKDGVAKPVLECSNVIVKELIKGKTVKEAVQSSYKKSADWILKLIYSKEPLAPASLQAVVANDSALDFKGESSAKIC